MNIYAVSALSASLIIALIGLYVFYKNPSQKVNRLYLISNFVIALWLFGCFGESNIIKNTAYLLLWDKFLNIFAVFSPAVFVHVIFTIIDSHEQRYLRLNYLISILLALSVFSPFYSLGVRAYYGVRSITIPGPLYYIFILFLCWCGYLSITRTLSAIRRAERGGGNQFKSLFAAVITIIVAAMTYFIMTLNIRILPIDNWLNVVYGLVMAYTITKTELMDIRVVITRAVAYGMVSILLIASFIGLNAFRLPMPIAMALNSLLALFWAWGAHRLRAFIQTPLEEKWITGWYDPGKLLNRIAQRLVPVMEREAVFKTVAEELKSAIKIKNVDIKMGKQDTSYQDVTQIKNGVVIPLSSSDGVEGLIILDQKVSEDPYNEKDLTLLRTIMLQILAVFDRIRPYENIKKEFEANQKQLYDTEKLLARSEKIASMAGLIQEYNHQIKTPLGIVRGRIETLFDKTRDIEYMQKMQKIILEQIDRVNYIVESTLRLSQPREHQEVELDLNEMVNSALDLFPPGGVHLVKELNPVPKIKGDKEDLQTLFINLIKNAIEAMPKGGELKIVTYSAEEEGKPVVSAEVSDTGVGIPQENMEKIFEPFFSTNVTKGRGLGLSIVFRITREHLGKINVKSQVGKGLPARLAAKRAGRQGSTFILKFPVKA